MPSLLPHVLSGRSQVSLFIASVVSPLHYQLEPQYLCVLRHQKILPGVLVYYTNHVTLRKVWIVKQRKTLGIYMQILKVLLLASNKCFLS